MKRYWPQTAIVTAVLAVTLLMLWAKGKAQSPPPAPPPIIALDLRMGETISYRVLYNDVWSTPGLLHPWPECVAISGGVVTAIAEGNCSTTAIIVNSGVIYAEAPIFFHVRGVPVVTTVTISSAPTSMQVGETATMSAQAFDQYGETIPAAIRFVSTKATVASVGSVSGLITAKKIGTAQLYAKVSGVQSAYVTLTVQ